MNAISCTAAARVLAVLACAASHSNGQIPSGFEITELAGDLGITNARIADLVASDRLGHASMASSRSQLTTDVTGDRCRARSCDGSSGITSFLTSLLRMLATTSLGRSVVGTPSTTNVDSALPTGA